MYYMCARLLSDSMCTRISTDVCMPDSVYVYVKETNMYVYATLHRFLYVCVTLYMYVRILRSIVCICEYVTCAFWGGLSMLMSMLCVYSGVCNRCGGLE